MTGWMPKFSQTKDVKTLWWNILEMEKTLKVRWESSAINKFIEKDVKNLKAEKENLKDQLRG